MSKLTEAPSELREWCDISICRELNTCSEALKNYVLDIGARCCQIPNPHDEPEDGDIVLIESISPNLAPNGVATMFDAPHAMVWSVSHGDGTYLTMPCYKITLVMRKAELAWRLNQDWPTLQHDEASAALGGEEKQ